MATRQGSPRFGILVALGAIATGTWFYFTPHLALRAMREAADARDAGALSSHVDYPAVRESLKTAVAERVGELAPAGLLGQLGAALVGTIADQAIDGLVTPESLAQILRGQRPAPGGGASPSPPDASSMNVDARYESFDRFVLTLAPKSSPTLAVRLVLVRHGLSTWLLSGVQLP